MEKGYKEWRKKYYQENLTKMKVLGITMGVCSSAALFKEGRIVACISEERFTKRKNYDGYPKEAIEFCLRYGNVDPSELDHVAFASNNIDPNYIVTHQECDRTVKDWVREMHEYWHPIFYGGRKKRYLNVFREKIDLKQYPGDFKVIPFNSDKRIAFFREFRKQVVSRHLKVPIHIVEICEHHMSHSAYALLGGASRNKKTLVFTADGFGDHSNATVRLFNGEKIILKYETDICNIGRLYRYITLLLGMKPGEHEYKVMGLAPYASPKTYQDILEIFCNTLYVDKKGQFRYKDRPVDYYFWFKKRLEGYRFDAIAGAVQRYVELLLSEWIGIAAKKYKVSNIAFSGGVSLNIKANQEILNLSEVSDLNVPGSGGDESLAIGAIFSLLLKKRFPIEEVAEINDLYLGDQVNNEDVERFIQSKEVAKDFNITSGVTAKDIAQLLAQGKIVGRFSGRMEFGQRALGNRSILANPSDLGVVKVINEIIKQRDFWMPFAPTILYEDCDRYLYNPKRVYSPFMTIGFNTKPAAHLDLIAALHPADLTARPQMLKRKDNPKYYDIIKAFKDLTGIGGVLNTSFNLHGLPIVQSFSDVMVVMNNSNLNYILIEDLLLERKSKKR